MEAIKKVEQIENSRSVKSKMKQSLGRRRTS
jgi:hypothetical protein